jgi:hypothetical protein
MLTCRRLPWERPDAVEAKQAEFRAEPEISIPSLGNGVNVTSEKSFADCPRGVSVFTDIEGWV